MKNVLQFAEADLLLNRYYKPVMDLLDRCIADCNRLYAVFSEESPANFKGRTKGSFINDRLKTRMQEHFQGDKNIRVVEYRGIFGIIVANRIFIRFNKMDENFRTAINKKTKQTRRFMSQAELHGFPANVTLVWGGYNPDFTWSVINAYYLVCFNDGVEWSYDMGREQSSQQLSLDLQPQQEKAKKRRVTPKRKPNDDQKQITGTNN